MKDKSYSEIINIIGIIPIIAPKELLENGKYKEVKYCSVAYGFADVNLFVDYDKYIVANMDKKGFDRRKCCQFCKSNKNKGEDRLSAF